MGKVKLRQKPISGGMVSLVLDFYPKFLNKETGKLSRFHTLKLYIYQKPRTELERFHNSETLTLAECVRAQRQIEIQRLRFGL